MIKNSREIAFSILYKVEFEKAYANISLSHDINSVKSADKGFLTELVYGVIEKKITLDYFIGKFSSVPVRKLDKSVLIILRLSCYQLAFMDKVPSHSVCDEAVKLAKKLGPQRSGYINAVLRSMSEAKLEVPKYSKKSFHSKIRYLSVYYSFPEWLIDRWINIFGEDEAIEIIKSFMKKPSFCIRFNQLKTTKDSLIKRLNDKGYVTKLSSISPYGIIINNPSGLFDTEEFLGGLFYVQDQAAMLVSQAVDPQQGQKILDCCSAPGGKTTHLAEIMNDNGKIVGCDIFPHKLSLIEQNAARLGIKSIETMLLDATENNSQFIDEFDKVMIDAPCSGTGLLGRKPEIKWTRNENNLGELPILQVKILKNCSDYVKLGGELVYSTCSIDKSENEEVVLKFLSEDSRYVLVDLGLPVDNDKKMITLYPHKLGCDGFFIAKMKRVE